MCTQRCSLVSLLFRSLVSVSRDRSLLEQRQSTESALGQGIRRRRRRDVTSAAAATAAAQARRRRSQTSVVQRTLHRLAGSTER